MKIAIIIARTLLGLIFFVFGLNAFFNFIPMPMPKGDAGTFMGILFSSHYLYATKCFEIGGGLILLSGRFTPLGLTLLGPVIVNIIAFHTFITRGVGLLNPMLDIIIVCALFLLWNARRKFAGLLN